MTAELAGGVSASLAPLVLVYVLLRVFNRADQADLQGRPRAAGDVSTRLQENLSGVVVIKIFGREQAGGASGSGGDRGVLRPADPGDQRPQPVLPVQPGGRVPEQRDDDRRRRVLHAPGRRQFTLGKLLLFRAYWWRLFGPVQTLARVNDMVQRASAAARRVFEVLDAPDELPDAPDAEPLEQVRGEMELRDVTFAYARVARASRPCRHRQRRRCATHGPGAADTGRHARAPARRLHPHRARPDRRALRPERVGQEHGAQPAAAVLRPASRAQVLLDGTRPAVDPAGRACAATSRSCSRRRSCSTTASSTTSATATPRRRWSR